jgi:type VI secretion system protein ImpJ
LADLKERLLRKSKFLIERRRDRGDGLAEFSSGDPYDFITLHSIYTSVPIVEHFITHGRAHPEDVYRKLLELAGALATFRTDVAPKDMPAYDHGAPTGTFTRLHALISKMLEGLPTAKAIRIPLEKIDGSRYVGRLEDQRLLEPAARLFLGVRAEVEEQQLLGNLPRITKIGSLDKLEVLISKNLPGVPRTHVRVTPAALPTKPSYLYFQLDSNSDDWEAVRAARNIAFFIPPQFPGLDLELLGLRE